MKLVDIVDPDPIYYCEVIDVCPKKDGGAAHPVSLIVAPKQGSVGQKFTFHLDFEVTQETGTGEVVVEIDCPASDPISDGFINEGFKAGNYTMSVSLDTNQQSSQTGQNPFVPGDYKVAMAYCEGSCGSKHAHAHDFGALESGFQLTE